MVWRKNMMMLLLWAVMAILMEYSLSKFILWDQNKKYKSPSTPYTRNRQAQSAQRGDCVGIHFFTEETGKCFCSGLSAPQLINVCSAESLAASLVVMGYAGFRSHYLPTPWVLEQTGCVSDLRASRLKHCFCLYDKCLSLLSGFLFCSVSCLSLQSSQVSAKIPRMFFKPFS